MRRKYGMASVLLVMLLVGCGMSFAASVIHVASTHKVGPTEEVFYSHGGKLAGWIEAVGRQWRVVIDGTPGPLFDEIGAPLCIGKARIDNIREEHATASSDKTRIFSPDGRHYAYCGRVGTQWYLIVDGQQSAGYHAVDEQGPIFSAQGTSVACAVCTNTRWQVISGTHGQPIGNACEQISQMVYSADGTRLLYAARQDDHWVVVVDGVAGNGYDQVSDLTVSADGKHYAYAAREDWYWRLVMDGVELGDYDAISVLCYNPAGNHLAYQVVQGSKQEVYLDTRSLGSFTGILELPTRFDASGQHLFFITSVYSKNALYRDGKAGKMYDDIANLTISADGTRVAFTVWTDDKVMLVDNGREISCGDMPGVVYITPDGKRTIYLRNNDAKAVRYENGVITARYDDIGDAAISLDGKHLAYAVRQGKQWFVMLDGKLSQAYEKVIGCPQFSPNSQRLAYFAVMNKRVHLVLDGQPLGTAGLIHQYQLLYPRIFFSEDSQHIAYLASDGAFVTVVIDQVPGPGHTELAMQLKDWDMREMLFFDGPDRLHYYVQKPDGVYRVDLQVIRTASAQAR